MADQAGVTILKNLPKSTSRHGITMEQYQALMADRPPKFSAADVGYGDAPSPDESCARCVHFFRNPMGRSVCEIFRPAGDVNGSENVDPTYSCLWFTKDYSSFPRLKSQK